MSDNESIFDPSFVMEEPDESQKHYNVPVRFLGQPHMWFKDFDDVDAVRRRLNNGENPEDIQRSMAPGSSPLKQEYGGEIKPWQSPVRPSDNCSLVNVPETIVDMQPQTKDGYGYTIYVNDQGETVRRATLPEWSQQDQ